MKLLIILLVLPTLAFSAPTIEEFSDNYWTGADRYFSMLSLLEQHQIVIDYQHYAKVLSPYLIADDTYLVDNTSMKKPLMALNNQIQRNRFVSKSFTLPLSNALLWDRKRRKYGLCVEGGVVSGSLGTLKEFSYVDLGEELEQWKGCAKVFPIQTDQEEYRHLNQLSALGQSIDCHLVLAAPTPVQTRMIPNVLGYLLKFLVVTAQCQASQ
ncbi:MAG: hypothetical protein C9356_12285 [Oleiphilus sp.]|nr:MAG: hypothetical protein C9356_12285 [Oleiphilus sp.]